MILKQQLQLLLQERDMTASEVARKAKVPRQNIYEWLNGRSVRNLDNLKKVADVLKVSVDALLFGKKESGAESAASAIHLPVDSEGWVNGVFEVRLRQVKETAVPAVPKKQS